MPSGTVDCFFNLWGDSQTDVDKMQSKQAFWRMLFVTDFGPQKSRHKMRQKKFRRTTFFFFCSKNIFKLILKPF